MTRPMRFCARPPAGSGRSNSACRRRTFARSSRMRKRRRVVDPDRQAPEVRRRLREFAPVLRREVPLAELADVDARLAAAACGSRFARGASRARTPRRRRPARPSASPRLGALPGDSRPRGEATLVATLSTKLVLPMPGRAATMLRSPGCSPAVSAVVAVESRRGPGDAVAALHRLGQRLERLLHHVEELLDAARLGRARDLVNVLLGAVDVLLGFAVVEVAGRRDALARRDELPHAEFLVDRTAVRRDVRDRRRRVEQLGHVRHAADLRDAVAVLQPRADLHDVDRLPDGAKLDRRLEDAPVRLGVKVLGLEELEHFVERAPVEHDGRQNRRFGVEIVRRNAPFDDQGLHDFCACFSHVFPRILNYVRNRAPRARRSKLSSLTNLAPRVESEEAEGAARAMPETT